MSLPTPSKPESESVTDGRANERTGERTDGRTDGRMDRVAPSQENRGRGLSVRPSVGLSLTYR